MEDTLQKATGDWGSKKDMEDTLNITRRRTRARKRGMEDTFWRRKRGKQYSPKVRMKHKGNGEHSPWKQKRTGGSKEDGKHSEHHAQTDARKEKRNGGHFLEKQQGKAEQPQGGKETQRE